MLSVQGLGYAIDQKFLFSNLTFELAPAMVLQVQGANGVGKSSLLKVLTGLYKASNGALKRTSSVLYWGHHLGLHPALSPSQNLFCLMQLQGFITRMQVDEALAKVGLEVQRHQACKTLSKGQCQRIGLARLLLDRSDLWILDEPCTGLDKKGCNALQAQCVQHLQRGGAIVLASHQSLPFESFKEQRISLGENDA